VDIYIYMFERKRFAEHNLTQNTQYSIDTHMCMYMYTCMYVKLLYNTYTVKQWIK